MSTRVLATTVIVHDVSLAMPFLGRALTYTDVNALSRDSLLDIVAVYPASAKILRRHSIFLALRRAVVRTAHELKMGMQTISVGSDGRVRVIGDFVDRMHEAAAGSLSEEQQQSMDVALSLAGTSDRDADKVAGGEGGMSAALAKELAEMMRTTQEEIKLLRKETKAQVEQLKEDVKAEIAELKASLTHPVST